MKRLLDILFSNRYLVVLLLIFSSNAVAGRYDPNESFSLLDVLLLPVSAFLIYLFIRFVDTFEDIFNKWLVAWRKNPSDTILMTMGVLGILFLIYAIFTSPSDKTPKANEVSPISQAGQIQPPPRREEKNDLIKLGEFTGQYGKFATYLDMSLILKANQTYTSALIADSYNECLGNMPYCQKFRVVLFDCAGEKFFVGRQMTSKNGKTIQDVTFKENEVKIKRISTGSIESKVADIICK